MLSTFCVVNVLRHLLTTGYYRCTRSSSLLILDHRDIGVPWHPTLFIPNNFDHYARFSTSISVPLVTSSTSGLPAMKDPAPGLSKKSLQWPTCITVVTLLYFLCMMFDKKVITTNLIIHTRQLPRSIK